MCLSQWIYPEAMPQPTGRGKATKETGDNKDPCKDTKDESCRDPGTTLAMNASTVGEVGHFARNCPQRCRTNIQSNLIDLNYEEEQKDTLNDKASDICTQINNMSPEERDHLAKTLEEEEDFPSA